MSYLCCWVLAQCFLKDFQDGENAGSSVKDKYYKHCEYQLKPVQESKEIVIERLSQGKSHTKIAGVQVTTCIAHDSVSLRGVKIPTIF